MDGAVGPVVSYSGSDTKAKHEIRSEIDLLDTDASVSNDGQMTSASIFLSGRLRSARLTQIGGARSPRVFKIANDAPHSKSPIKGSGTISLDTMPFESDGLAAISEANVPLNSEAATQELQQPHSITYQLLHVTTRQWRYHDNDNDNKDPRIRTLYEVLALEPIKGRESEFVRVGAGEISFDSWFEEQPVQRIRIF